MWNGSTGLMVKHFSKKLGKRVLKSKIKKYGPIRFPNQKRVCEKVWIGDGLGKNLTRITSAWFDTAQKGDDFLILICSHRDNTSIRK
jgi:hypothetical protein